MRPFLAGLLVASSVFARGESTPRNDRPYPRSVEQQRTSTTVIVVRDAPRHEARDAARDTGTPEPVTYRARPGETVKVVQVRKRSGRGHGHQHGRTRSDSAR